MKNEKEVRDKLAQLGGMRAKDAGNSELWNEYTCKIKTLEWVLGRWAHLGVNDQIEDENYGG